MVIIGAGPAGIATAIQLKRYRIEPLLLEKNKIGGLLRNANLVENYPGFPNGISGLNLVKLFEAQIKQASVKILFEEVVKLDLEEGIFRIETQKRIFYSRIVAVASGTKHRKYEIPEEVRDKIFYEIYPILEIEGREIVIVGAGDVAFDYAMNLQRNNEVVILNRAEKAKCLPLLQEKVKTSSRITYKENTEISKIARASRDRVSIECKTPKGIENLYVDYIIFAIGRDAQLDYLSQELKKNAPEIGGNLFPQDSLYFVGDVKNGIFRQTAIAVGDGIRAAMKIYRKLNEEAPL